METMTQEDKDLLMKDLCARLPYGVKCEIVIYRPVDGEVVDIFTDTITFENISKYTDARYKIRPYLFPLSSITDEQEKELSKLGVTYLEYALHDDIRGLGIMVDEAYIFFEFCYKHHIDFLGLIEMGLAIDATGKNIY